MLLYHILWSRWITCLCTFLCTLRVLFQKKVCSILNFYYLLMSFHFLFIKISYSHESVKVENWELIHWTAIKGYYGSLCNFNANLVNQSKRKYLVLQNRKESLSACHGRPPLKCSQVFACSNPRGRTRVQVHKNTCHVPKIICLDGSNLPLKC